MVLVRPLTVSLLIIGAVTVTLSCFLKKTQSHLNHLGDCRSTEPQPRPPDLLSPRAAMDRRILWSPLVTGQFGRPVYWHVVVSVEIKPQFGVEFEHQFSLGYLVSGIFCLNSVQRWLEFCVRTGCSYRLPCVWWNFAEWVGSSSPLCFLQHLHQPFPAFACPLIMGISLDCNQREAWSTLQQHQLKINPDLAQSVTQAFDPSFLSTPGPSHLGSPWGC